MERQLGKVETLLYKLDEIHPGNLSVIARINHKFTTSLIEKAINLVKSRHPLMNMSIINKNGKLFFMPTAKLFVLTEINTGNLPLCDIINKELNTHIDKQYQSLFRAKIIYDNQNTILLLTFHHLILDGISICYFLYDVLQVLDILISDGIKKITRTIYDIRPSLDYYFSGVIQYSCAVNTITQTQHKMQVSRLIIPEKLTTKLLFLCGKNNISVYDIVCTILSLQTIINTDTNQREISIQCPINMKPTLRIAPQEFGYYLSRMDIKLKIENMRNIWEIAALFRQHFETALSLKNHITFIEILQNFDCAYFKTNNNEQNLALLVSNLGKLPYKTRFNNFELEELYASVGYRGMLNNKNFFWTTFLTIENRMMFAFHFVNNGDDSKNRITKIINGFYNTILSLPT